MCASIYYKFFVGIDWKIVGKKKEKKKRREEAQVKEGRKNIRKTKKAKKKN